MNLNTLLQNGVTYLMNSEYQRLKKGERLTLSGEPYSIKIFDNITTYFEGTEEYEKCIILRNIKSSWLDHENNYSNEIFRPSYSKV
jgi:hypothetical protein